MSGTLVDYHPNLSSAVIELKDFIDVELVGQLDSFEALMSFQMISDGCILVGCNISAQYNFLRTHGARYKTPFKIQFRNKRIDILKLTKKKLKVKVENLKLETLLKYFDLNSVQHHYAINRVVSMVMLFMKLVEL